ncbi:hypothetical protein M4D56_01830 [Cytobacillus oceanisediminis]|uniref:hypothetical protein n=1 Tax=Cytobacillus oceanisediminis TaxID=665099 RepID=UPI00203A47FB|nr:hypothetical protein [Cytobacillus oceanisediminis]MCM3527834.1 hypothetical protein [Cytobacillus oceanisediminis]
MSSPGSFFDTKLFIALITSTVTIIIFILGQISIRSLQKKNDKRNTLILITQSNSALFSLIYRGSIDEKNLDYLKLREELIKSNVIFVLPNEVKHHFRELYKIHFSGGDYYDQNKDRIHKTLKNIVEVLNNYGVETFGY